MVSEKIKVVVFAENCVRAGRSVPVREIEAAEDGEESFDFLVFEGTAEDLLADADRLSESKNGPFAWRCARTIREEVGGR